mmetsp:Transcript_54950/g.159054  ORF Transcript_54950/g.159054 Transcript_54950/m.159054 type:complete len:241 (-) Transcript_54950:213-935(-)
MRRTVAQVAHGGIARVDGPAVVVIIVVEAAPRPRACVHRRGGLHVVQHVPPAERLPFAGRTATSASNAFRLRELALHDGDDLRGLELAALRLVPRQLDAEAPRGVVALELHGATDDLERHCLAPTAPHVAETQLQRSAPGLPSWRLGRLIEGAERRVPEQRHVPRHTVRARDAATLQQGAVPLREAQALQPRLVDPPNRPHGHVSAAAAGLERRRASVVGLVLQYSPLRLSRTEELLDEL